MNTVIIVNGKPRSGKDTVSKYITEYCEEQGTYCDVWSTIDVEKEILEEYVKQYDTTSNIDRAFLSDLKQLLNEYYNYTFESFKSIIDLNDGIIIIHTREWEEIQNFKIYCEQNNINFITIFVTGKFQQEMFTNVSDKYCDDYYNHYDYKIHNYGTLEELRENVRNFCESRLF